MVMNSTPAGELTLFKISHLHILVFVCPGGIHQTSINSSKMLHSGGWRRGGWSFDLFMQVDDIESEI